MEEAFFTLPERPTNPPDETGMMLINHNRPYYTVAEGLSHFRIRLEQLLHQTAHLQGSTVFWVEVWVRPFTLLLGRGLTCVQSWEWRKAELTSTWKVSIDSCLRKCLGCIYIMLFLSYSTHKNDRRMMRRGDQTAKQCPRLQPSPSALIKCTTYSPPKL